MDITKKELQEMFTTQTQELKAYIKMYVDKAIGDLAAMTARHFLGVDNHFVKIEHQLERRDEDITRLKAQVKQVRDALSL